MIGSVWQACKTHVFQKRLFIVPGKIGVPLVTKYSNARSSKEQSRDPDGWEPIARSGGLLELEARLHDLKS